MGSNQYWVQKADLVVQDFISNGGYLNAEQASELFEIQINESVLLGLITFKPMKAATMEISKLGFTGRVLRGAVENQGLTLAERSAPTAGKTTLSVVELIAEADVPYGALEDHVTQGTLMTHLKNLLGKAFARDLEYLAIQGDTGSADLLLKKLNGFIAQCTSNTFAAGGVRLTKSTLKQMSQTMPSQYYKNSAMAYFTSKNAVIDYEDSLSSRATPLGDQALVSAGAQPYGGKPVVPVPEFPENLGLTTDQTIVLMCDPKNMHVGMQREVTLETAADISARKWKVVMTAKADFKFAHEPAVVLATGITADAGP